MSRPLASVLLAAPGDIVAARTLAHRLAELLGLDRQGQTRIATAVSEIARNAYSHGGGGKVEYAVDSAPSPEVFEIIVRDRGPGIDDLQAVLSGQKTFLPGHGAGLLHARRLADRMDISSEPGATVVRLAQRIPRASAARLDAQALQSIAKSLPGRRADPIEAMQAQNRELADSLQELQERQAETARLNRELEETNRGVVALYSELDQKAEQLRDVSEMKSRFLSHMSHEFRTPLNSILALSRLLIDRVDGSLNDEQALQVEYVRKSAQGLLEMVNDLLDLAKVEAGKMDVKPGPCRVTDLFASLRGSLKPLLGNRAVELVFDDPAGLPELHTDEHKLAQIMRNLLSNALKFTERGQVRARARHEPARGRIVFMVEDTGVGIAPTALEVIFEEFSQVDGRLQHGGTGLGLPLSRRLALLMGGDIAVRSVVDVGSTFELSVPVRFGEDEQPQEHISDGSACVLVVDDEEAFRYVVRHIASDAGYRVAEAADGQAGLELALARRPDLVVLDLYMPRMDGFTMLQRLAESELRTTPVIVCTSQMLTMDQKRSLAAAYAIVPKHEVSRDGLTALMKTVLHGTGDHA